MGNDLVKYMEVVFKYKMIFEDFVIYIFNFFVIDLLLVFEGKSVLYVFILVLLGGYIDWSN